MEKKWLCVLLLWCCSLNALPQDGYPVLNEPVPDFVLENVQNYPTDRLSSADLQGKYVILDFWHRHCASCLMAFPKLNDLAKQFRDELEIINIGLEDKKGLAALYNQLKERYGLIMPSAFDAVLYDRFVPRRVAPHYVWLNPQGVVVAATGPGDVTEANISSFVAGRPFSFTDESYAAYQRKYTSYDPYKPFMLDGNGGRGYDVRYRSLLLDHLPNEMPEKPFPLSFKEAERIYGAYGRKIEGIGALAYLYKFAYLGYASWANNDSVYSKLYPELTLEIADPSAFESNYTTGKNIYWYSFMLPDRDVTEEEIRNVMQADFALSFGYRASVEIREQPCWKVIATEGAIERLRSKGGGDKSWGMDEKVHWYRNFPFEEFLASIFYRVYLNEPPIINETGFTGNIDIDFNDGLLTDFETIRDTLATFGIQLEKGSKPFKTLVISE